MLDGNNSYEQRPEFDNSFDSARHGNLINNSLANSTTKPNPLALSHEEPRKRSGKPSTLQNSMMSPITAVRR